MMNKEIQKGDRIFARLTMAGKPILEFMINTVADMDELMMELRRMTSSLRGLGRLQVRNQSRGWMSVSNLMFYGDHTMNDVRSAALSGYSNATATKAAVKPAVKSAPMLFPWETH